MKKLSMSLVIAVAAVGVASAQISGTNTTAYGTGTLRLGSNTESLRQATVVLKDNGRFEVAVYPLRGDAWRCDGRYTRRSSSSATLEIRDGTGNARGTGTVIIGARQRLESIELSGTSQRGAFTVTFDSEVDRPGIGRPGGGSESGFEINRSNEGTGRIRIGSSSGTLNKAYVELKNNGDAQIKVMSSKTYEFKGVWRRVRGNYEVDIESGFDSSRTQGRATIDGNGGNFSTLNISGKDAYGDTFTVVFTSDRGSGGIGTKPGDYDIGGSYVGQGEGTVKILLDERDKLRRADVRLNANGTFQITLNGDKRWTFGGTWRRRDDNEATLTITTSNQDSRAKGSGRVMLRSGNLYRIELSPKMNDRNYGIRFQVD